MADKIIISGLTAYAVIGTLPHEREAPQKIILHAELLGDFSAAEKSDDFRDTFDYSAVEKSLRGLTEQSSFQLLEALAGFLAGKILEEQPLIHEIRLRIDKPAAPRYAECISIEINRKQQGS